MLRIPDTRGQGSDTAFARFSDGALEVAAVNLKCIQRTQEEVGAGEQEGNDEYHGGKSIPYLPTPEKPPRTGGVTFICMEKS